jgi:hypothetical protein
MQEGTGLGVVRIEDLDGFKKAVRDLTPATIMYSVDPDPESKPPLNLRLVFYHNGNTYLYIDRPDNSHLKETKIPISIPRKGAASIEDKEILRLLSNEIKNVDFVGFFDI